MTNEEIIENNKVISIEKANEAKLNRLKESRKAMIEAMSAECDKFIALNNGDIIGGIVGMASFLGINIYELLDFMKMPTQAGLPATLTTFLASIPISFVLGYGASSTYIKFKTGAERFDIKRTYLEDVENFEKNNYTLNQMENEIKELEEKVNNNKARVLKK